MVSESLESFRPVMDDPWLPAMRDTLKKYFGFDAFRPLQEEIISTILDKKDCLIIVPTGGGKSLCFQVPGLIMGGTVVVVSPLISLMEDQVHQLQQRNVSAALITSSLTIEEKKITQQRVARGEYQFVYVAPEQLKTKSWQQITASLEINLVVIDEAHCISQWGHDFRPSYRHINDWLQTRKTKPTVAAFTATATPQTASDIIASLQLSEPVVIKQDELPAHLYLSVQTCPDLNHKLIRLLQILQKHAGQAGIIYTLTRKDAETITHFLQKLNFHEQWGELGYYHGGMSAKERQDVQNAFISNKLQIIAATNAFGMGVDKPDIRFVIHYQVPNSIEAYSQEVGRAGRDRQAASCYLLYCQKDLKINYDLVGLSPSKQEKLRQMLHILSAKKCLKAALADYFSINWKIDNCGQCGQCIFKEVRQENDLQIYQKLLSWRQNESAKNNLEPSFLLSQFQAALLSILKPTTIDQLQKIPSFGTGWIEQCWPRLINGKIDTLYISEAIKEN